MKNYFDDQGTCKFGSYGTVDGVEKREKTDTEVYLEPENQALS